MVEAGRHHINGYAEVNLQLVSIDKNHTSSKHNHHFHHSKVGDRPGFVHMVSKSCPLVYNNARFSRWWVWMGMDFPRTPVALHAWYYLLQNEFLCLWFCAASYCAAHIVCFSRYRDNICMVLIGVTETLLPLVDFALEQFTNGDWATRGGGFLNSDPRSAPILRGIHDPWYDPRSDLLPRSRCSEETCCQLD